MSRSIQGKKVAILVTDGFEEVELTEPKKALEDAGAQTKIVAPKGGKVKAWATTEWGKEYPVDLELSKASPDDFDALLLPGGVMNPDKLRMDEKAVSFVSSFLKSGKPIGAICHGPWTLVETKSLKGRKMTSYRSIRTDLENAGVQWSDTQVVTDNGLVTSRQPSDIPAFNEKLIEEIAEGRHTAGHDRAA